jgi:5-formyltetrahydrofolate cyclo-ligase
MTNIDLILVPGLVFDRYGYRVGYGKGYYDRLIETHPNVITIGVCLDEFFIERLPSEPWDARVNFVATQLGIFKTECEVL